MLHCLLLHSRELYQAIQPASEKHWRCITSDWQLPISSNILTATSCSGSDRLAREILHCIPLKMWKISSKQVNLPEKATYILHREKKLQLWKMPDCFALSMPTPPATPTTHRGTGPCWIERGSSHQEHPKGEIFSWVQSGAQSVAINYLLEWRSREAWSWPRCASAGI